MTNAVNSEKRSQNRKRKFKFLQLTCHLLCHSLKDLDMDEYIDEFEAVAWLTCHRPKQSFFWCAFHSILGIVIAFVLVATNTPTYDQEYNDPAEYDLTNDTVIYLGEWKYTATYVKGFVI